MSDAYEIARDALALAEKATPGPWRLAAWSDDRERIDTLEAPPECRPDWKPDDPGWLASLPCRVIGMDEPVDCQDNGEANFALIIHARQHYAALARELLRVAPIVEAAETQSVAFTAFRRRNDTRAWNDYLRECMATNETVRSVRSNTHGANDDECESFADVGDDYEMGRDPDSEAS